MTEEIENKESKPKNKPGRPPKKSSPEGSRIPYKDRHKLTLEDRDPGYVYRWANHDNDKWAQRIDILKRRGYTLADDSETVKDSGGVEPSTIGSKTSRPAGGGKTAVLMKQKKEYYEEDQAAKQAEVDRTEDDMVSEELREAEDTYGSGLKVTRDRQKPSFNVQSK